MIRASVLPISRIVSSNATARPIPLRRSWRLPTVRREQRRRFGNLRPIIHTEFQGKKLVTLGNRLRR